MRRTTTPTRWRAVPTVLVVLCAMGLGAVTARADDRPAFPKADASHRAHVPIT